MDHNNHCNNHLPWRENWEISKFFALDIVLTGDICPKCIFLGGKLLWLWLIGNRTSCHPIQSVIILVIDKSDSRFAVVRFCKSLVWLQTELDSTWSYYHYELYIKKFFPSTRVIITNTGKNEDWPIISLKNTPWSILYTIVPEQSLIYALSS